MRQWRFVELGGSSAQTSFRDVQGYFWFVPGVVVGDATAIALACPGVVHDGRVRYATHLGWPDEADPRHELGIEHIQLVVNDAEAAALGEALLRQTSYLPNLLYITLGTGIGSAVVINGVARDADIGHAYVSGTKYCRGCRSVGCLNSELAAAALPPVLTKADQTFVVEKIALALRVRAVDVRLPIVLGGGIARRYAELVPYLAHQWLAPVEASAAPPEAKSAAYLGLEYLAGQLND